MEEKRGDRGMIGQELKGERIKEQRCKGKQGSGQHAIAREREEISYTNKSCMNKNQCVTH